MKILYTFNPQTGKRDLREMIESLEISSIPKGQDRDIYYIEHKPEIDRV